MADETQAESSAMGAARKMRTSRLIIDTDDEPNKPPVRESCIYKLPTGLSCSRAQVVEEMCNQHHKMSQRLMTEEPKKYVQVPLQTAPEEKDSSARSESSSSSFERGDINLDTIDNDILDKMLSDKTDAAIGEFIVHIYELGYLPNLKVIDEKGPYFVYNKKKLLWKRVTQLSGLHNIAYKCMRYVLSELHRDMLEMLKELEGKTRMLMKSKIENVEKIILKIGSASKCEHALKFALGEICDKKNIALFDSKDHLLPVAGGEVVDLRTGEARPRVAKDYFTWECPTKYNPNAVFRGQFRKFIKRFCCQDPIRIDRLQRSCGYWMTGSIAEQKYFLMVNDGRNGKSALFKILQRILGEDVLCFAEIATICGRDVRGNQSDLIEVVRHRIVVMPEPGPEDKINQRRLEKLTGEKKSNLKEMYETNANYTHKCKLIFPANFPIETEQRTDGGRRRVREEPALAKFALTDVDYDKFKERLADGTADFLRVYRAILDIDEKLTDEDLEIGLAWLVSGSVKYYSADRGQGLSTEEFAEMPAVIPEAISTNNQDYLTTFINNHLMVEEGAQISRVNLLTLWNTFRKNKSVVMKAKESELAIEAALSRLGIIKERADDHKPYFFKGCREKSSHDNDEDSSESSDEESKTPERGSKTNSRASNNNN
jgi:hypothetical protein